MGRLSRALHQSNRVVHTLCASSPGKPHRLHSQVTWFRIFLPTGWNLQDGTMFRMNTNRSGPDPVPRLRRQHRATLRQLDRRALEREGWRTTLEFRENHVRSESGRLLRIETLWVAEAERGSGASDTLDVLSATAVSESRAWAALRSEATKTDQVRTFRYEPGPIPIVG